MQIFLYTYLVVSIALLASSVEGQPGGGPKKAVPNKRDLPGVACATCTAAAYVLHDFMTQMYNALAEDNRKGKAGSPRFKKRKLDEDQVAEVLDSVCDPDAKNGEWLRHYDIVEVPVAENDPRKTLSIEWNEGAGKCGKECQTLALSCKQMLEEEVGDRDALQELLYKNKLSSKELVEKLCRKMTKRCTIERTLAPGYEREDEVWSAMSEHDLQMEQLQKEMAAMGMGGAQMYDRDSINDMQQEMMDGYGDEDMAAGMAGAGDFEGLDRMMGGGEL